MVVKTLADRDDLPVDSDTFQLNADGISSGQRKVGMRVKVLEDNTEYELAIPDFATLPNPTAKVNALGNNANWQEYKMAAAPSGWLIQPFLIDETVPVPDGHHFIIRNPTFGSNGQVELGNNTELLIL